ncbi:MAG: GIY-YIG nuclease family protein [Arenicellales bacterium WSBS_2016_MAG_OTU3]
MQTIIYVMRHIDIGEHINDIPYKKVGITGAGNATLSSRLQQISDTKSPIKAQCIAAWKHEDARAVENALHTLMEDSRIEGEWFLDKEDTLVERMQPIMKLIGAEEIAIEQSNDAYTQSFLKKEDKTKQQSDHILLGEISSLLDKPLRSSSTVNGPTFFNDEKPLTYYVFARKSGRHHLLLGRIRNIYEDIKKFLESHNFDVEQAATGEAKVIAISTETVAKVINLIEREFEPK